jgi:hypothetical protein
MALHVLRDAMAGPIRVRRQADDSHPARARQEFGNRFEGLGHREVLSIQDSRACLLCFIVKDWARRTLRQVRYAELESFIDGSGIHLGEKQWPIASDSEVVLAYARDEKIYGDRFEFTDPGFYFMGKRGKTDLYIDYARYMGILRFIAVEENESMIECAFAQQSSKL